MKLSYLNEKSVYAGKTFRGVCRGVALSLKSQAVKYLLCASTLTQTATDFSVGVSAVTEVGESILLSRLRPAYPKNCAKITIGLPVYSFEGGYLGVVEDLEMRDFVATRLFTDRGDIFPITSLFACSDAVILRKEPPYPLGQRIPASLLPIVTDKSEALVTKPILRAAIQKRALVKLTLSLPPFNMENEAPRRRFFG